MQEFWNWFLDWWPSIATAATAVVTGLASFLVYRLKLRSAKAKALVMAQELDRAKYRLTYHVCPHCGKPVLLSEIKWMLPGNIQDQNLNGVPDNQE